MADVQAVNYAATYGATPIGKVASNVNRGRMRVLHDTYEAAAAADGTEILLGKLTEGAVIHDFLVLTDDLGTSTTLTLAVRDDDDGTETAFSPDIDTDGAATVTRPAAADIGRMPVVVDEDVTLIAQIGGGAATGTIEVTIFYTVD